MSLSVKKSKLEYFIHSGEILSGLKRQGSHLYQHTPDFISQIKENN